MEQERQRGSDSTAARERRVRIAGIAVVAGCVVFLCYAYRYNLFESDEATLGYAVALAAGLRLLGSDVRGLGARVRRTAWVSATLLVALIAGSALAVAIFDPNVEGGWPLGGLVIAAYVAVPSFIVTLLFSLPPFSFERRRKEEAAPKSGLS